MSDLSVFGNIEYVRSDRATRLSVKIRAEGLKVVLPRGVSQSRALEFLLKEKERILFRQRKVRARAGKLLLSEDYEIRTATFAIRFVKVDRQDVFFQMKDETLTVQIPEHVDLQSAEVQKICWNGINYFLRKEAKRILPERVSDLAEQFGFQFSDVKIQSGKTRWGSCSSKKSINLSLYLLLLPEHLMDYVILHELCHTVEMNHSDRFWKLMDDVTGGKSGKLRAEMKKYAMPGE